MRQMLIVVLGDHPWGRSPPRASGQMVSRFQARAGGEGGVEVRHEPIQPLGRELESLVLFCRRGRY